MDARTKLEIGRRLRRRRENAGYTRERLGELCSLSPRFIANIELGDSTFSLDSLMTICQVLSCSSDHLLFGAETGDGSPWADTISRIRSSTPAMSRRSTRSSRPSWSFSSNLRSIPTIYIRSPDPASLRKADRGFRSAVCFFCGHWSSGRLILCPLCLQLPPEFPEHIVLRHLTCLYCVLKLPEIPQPRPLIAAVTPAQPVVILCRSIRWRYPALRRQSPEPLTRNIPLCPAARGHVLFHCVPLIRQIIRRPAKTYPSVMYPKPQQPLPRPENHLSSHIIYEQLSHFNSHTAKISLYWQRSPLS